MLAECKHTLRRMRGQIIGWSIGVALYGLLMASLFDSIAEIEGLQEIIASYPQELLAFFGDLQAIATAQGYLDIYYFTYMHLIIGIFAVAAGAGLVVGDEERGTLDLIMAHPISRSSLFWGRLAGYLGAIAIILLAGWLSWVIPAQSTGMSLTWLEFLRPFLPLFAILTLFGGLALLLSMFLPSTRMAGMVAGGLLVANFLVSGLANTNDSLEAIVELTPLNFYQAGGAIDGVNWGWFAGLLGVGLVLALLSWWRFLQRDIRVGGEGGWRLPPALQRFRRGHREAEAGTQA